jgi:hypothetical protein
VKPNPIDRQREIDESVANIMADMERPCCGTFKGSPHRATCSEYKGKFKVRPSVDQNGAE